MKYELDDFALMLLVTQHSDADSRKEMRPYAKALLAEYVVGNTEERAALIDDIRTNITKLIADLAALDGKMKAVES